MNRSNSGFSIIEVLAGTIMLTIGLVGLMASFTSASRITQEAHENDLCAYALRNVVANLQSVQFSTIAHQFSDAAQNDAFWIDAAGNVTFAQQPGKDAFADGAVEIYADESLVPADFGGKDGGFDLNGDGAVASGEITDYLVLPVRVSLTINGLMGARSVTMDLLLANPSQGG